MQLVYVLNESKALKRHPFLSPHCERASTAQSKSSLICQSSFQGAWGAVSPYFLPSPHLIPVAILHFLLPFISCSFLMRLTSKKLFCKMSHGTWAMERNLSAQRRMMSAIGPLANTRSVTGDAAPEPGWAEDPAFCRAWEKQLRSHTNWRHCWVYVSF